MLSGVGAEETTVKILLVEDDQPTSLLLANALTAHHYTVNLAGDGQTGLDLADRFEYDLIVLDIGLPRLDGISLCKQLRARGWQGPILLLTAKDRATDRVMGLDAGADDYMVKPFDMEELLARIRALLRRGKPISSSVITWGALQFDPSANLVTGNGRPVHLTPKEYCLLELFLLNPTRIFSRRAILDRLWDFAESPGEETVSTHIKCVRQKLKAVGVSDPIETVHGLGYRLRPLLPAPADSDPLLIPRHQEDLYRRKLATTTARVWEKSRDRFLSQVDVLEQAAIALSESNLSPELQQQATQEAHKLAGSLGIFGLMAASQRARELEELLQSQVILDCAQAPQFLTQIRQLRQDVQQQSTPGADSAKPPVPLLLIVDDDLALAERVRVEAIAWGLRVELATDLSVARKSIANFPPDAILLDLTFPGSEDGLALLEELTQRSPQIPVVVFTGRGTLDDRLQVARGGGTAFLQKPLPTYEILKTVTGVLKRQQHRHHNRVLVVEDDSAGLEPLATLLQSAGIDITVLSHPQQLWDVMTKVMPNLLILDLAILNVSAIDLCQAVRNDPHWHDLPILFWSTNPSEDIIDRAFAAGADDYISKTTNHRECVTHIVRHLRRVGFKPPSFTVNSSHVIQTNSSN